MLMDAIGLPIFSTAEHGGRTGDATAEVSFNFEYSPLGIAIAFLVGLLYFASLESSARQATIGKMALAIRVTDLEGRRIGRDRAALRYIAKVPSAAILFVGFIMAGFTARKQALHDVLAGCLVVNGRA